jgi:hypothetical protein
MACIEISANKINQGTASKHLRPSKFFIRSGHRVSNQDFVCTTLLKRSSTATSDHTILAFFHLFVVQQSLAITYPINAGFVPERVCHRESMSFIAAAILYALGRGAMIIQNTSCQYVRSTAAYTTIDNANLSTYNESKPAMSAETLTATLPFNHCGPPPKPLALSCPRISPCELNLDLSFVANSCETPVFESTLASSLRLLKVNLYRLCQKDKDCDLQKILVWS